MPSRRMLGVVATVLLCALVAAAVGVSSASATCNENGSLFWQDATQGFAGTGTKQDLVVRKHSYVGAGCERNGTIAGGTSHMSPQNGHGALVEVGWMDKTDSNGNHYYRLFTESCFTSGCNTLPYSSGCASAGTTVTEEVRSSYVGSNVWNFYYACNGGGFSSLGNSGGQSFAYASPRVETFRFGPSGDSSFILDYHNVLTHWDKVGNFHSNMGDMTCALGMLGTFGHPNANPATSYVTKSSGSC